MDTQSKYIGIDKTNFWMVEYVLTSKKGPTIKGKNIGSIVFPLKVAHIRIDNAFKGH